MNIVAYTISVRGKRGRPDSITVQANIVKRSIEIILDIGATSGIKNLEHYHQYEIEIEKDEYEASKNYE
ncbi:hypothetical protein F8M41_002231 [Gigaspora margarita]|uniref:Uncharacterized protein n=1 Tax=Gigaspora margarita TaxID=4874 RepID=A0A8H4AYM2_GIGMA|nr:hypothetical protein F8M41_002231 [Gigaspora margarita]